MLCTRESSQEYQQIFQQVLWWAKELKCYIQSDERKEKKTAKNTLPGKVVTQKGRRESFPDKQKLEEFITTKSALQEILKDFLKIKRKCTN